MAECAVLLHPSNLESGGSAVMESLAAGRPVIALDMGGPALLLDDSRGVKLQPTTSADIVDGMAVAMRRLANVEIRKRMAENCRRFVRDHAIWSAKGRLYAETLRNAR